MAWSPQSRAAALAARRRKGHSSKAMHMGGPYVPKGTKRMKHTVTAVHPGKHSQFKGKAKKAAKYTAIGLGAGAATYGAFVGGYNAATHGPPAVKKAVRTQVSKKVRKDARARLATKSAHIETIKVSRKMQQMAAANRPGSLFHATGPYAAHDRAVAGANIRQINRYSKRTPYKRPGSKKTRYR